MGKYYGVKAVIQLGERIGEIKTARKQPDVRENEVLVGIASNGLWLIAPDLTDAYQYEAFRKTYARGDFIAILLYKIKKSALVNCPDEGRVETNEFKDSQELHREFLGI